MSRGTAMPPGGTLKPLRWPGVIHDGESLLGVVTRRSAEHFLGSTHIVTRASGIDVQRQGDALIVATKDNIGELARLLRVDRSTLQNLVCERIGADAVGSILRWGARTIRQRDLEVRVRRIAPSALARSPHHRQAWLLRRLPYCPETFEELIDECPSCGRSLRWTHAKPVGFCDDPSCRFGNRLIEPTGKMLRTEWHETYRHFCDLVSVNPAVAEGALKKLPNEIRVLDNPTLLDLVYLMAIIDRLEDSRAPALNARALTSDANAERIARGCDAVRGWPHSIREVVTHAVDNLENDRHLWQRLKWHSVKNPNPEIRRLLVAAVPELTASARQVVAPGRNPIMLQKELLERTSLQIRHMKVLQADNHLGGSRISLKTRSLPKFDRARAEILIGDLKRSVNTSSVASRLGLPGYGVHQLSDSGHLDKIINPAVDAIFPNGRITAASVEELCGKLKQVALDPQPHLHTIALTAAAAIVGGGPKPWDQIVEMLLAKEIPCFANGATTHSALGCVRIGRADLRILRKVRAWTLDQGWLPEICSKLEASEILNATHDDVVDLVEAGVLSFRASGKKLACCTDAILSIASERMFRTEAALFLDIASQSVNAVTDAHGIPTLSGGGWCRRSMMKLLEWRQANESSMKQLVLL
ncbi:MULTISPECIES: hypothetical protein [unclassified Sphingomonas]|jgi:hypothetical protein|uniref:hypothetical protein n=1 Tax=unclassified Sphingomonas TaxID=196159 RepID=UPI000832ED28|nr:MULTISPECIES: hypothetical protein [unclassified Sphingomonas]